MHIFGENDIVNVYNYLKMIYHIPSLEKDFEVLDTYSI